MKKNNLLRLSNYLEHILEAIKNINEYTDDMIEQSFIQNRLVQDAVIRNFEIIGEACQNIKKHFPEITKKYPELPLEDAYEMRNALSHGYFKVDLPIVWRTIEKDLPKLQKQIKNIYEDIKAA